MNEFVEHFGLAKKQNKYFGLRMKSSKGYNPKVYVKTLIRHLEIFANLHGLFINN